MNPRVLWFSFVFAAQHLNPLSMLENRLCHCMSLLGGNTPLILQKSKGPDTLRETGVMGHVTQVQPINYFYSTLFH